MRVPRKPKAAVLQIPTPHLALAGVMAANNGEWRNKFGPFQSATQAFHECFEKLFPITLRTLRVALPRCLIRRRPCV